MASLSGGGSRAKDIKRDASGSLDFTQDVNTTGSGSVSGTISGTPNRIRARVVGQGTLVAKQGGSVINSTAGVGGTASTRDSQGYNTSETINGNQDAGAKTTLTGTSPYKVKARGYLGTCDRLTVYIRDANGNNLATTSTSTGGKFPAKTLTTTAKNTNFGSSPQIWEKGHFAAQGGGTTISCSIKGYGTTTGTTAVNTKSPKITGSANGSVTLTGGKDQITTIT